MRRGLVLGVLCMSALSFADVVDLTKPGTANSNVFEGYQTGAVKVQGRMVAKPESIKYVIAGTKDGSELNDVVSLSGFVMSNDSKKAGFIGGNEKIKVMRVVSEQAVPLQNESVVFEVENDTIKNMTLNGVKIYEGQTQQVLPYQLLSKAQLDEVARKVTEANPTGGNRVYSIDSYGYLNTDNGYRYSPAKRIKIEHKTKGELVFSNGDKYYPSYEVSDTREISAIESAFEDGQSIGGATKVKVNISL